MVKCAAIGAAKAQAIAAAIRGNYFTTLFIDESAAREVLKIFENQVVPREVVKQYGQVMRRTFIPCSPYSFPEY